MAIKAHRVNIGTEANLPDTWTDNDTLFVTEKNVYRSNGNGNALVNLSAIIQVDALPDNPVNGKLYIIGAAPNFELYWRIHNTWFYFGGTSTETSTTIISKKTVNMDEEEVVVITPAEFTTPLTGKPELVEFIYQYEAISLDFEVSDDGTVTINDSQGLTGITVRATRDVTSTGGGKITINLEENTPFEINPWQFSPPQSDKPESVEFIHQYEKISIPFTVNNEGKITITSSYKLDNVIVKRT